MTAEQGQATPEQKGLLEQRERRLRQLVGDELADAVLENISKMPPEARLEALDGHIAQSNKEQRLNELQRLLAGGGPLIDGLRPLIDELLHLVEDECAGRAMKEISRLPPRADRREVLLGLVLCAHEKRGHDMLSPAWCRKRDEHLRALAVAAPEPLRADVEEFKKRLGFGRDRVSMEWEEPGAGRHSAGWKTEGADHMRGAGASVRDVRRILAAAGLAEKTPSRVRG